MIAFMASPPKLWSLLLFSSSVPWKTWNSRGNPNIIMWSFHPKTFKQTRVGRCPSLHLFCSGVNHERPSRLANMIPLSVICNPYTNIDCHWECQFNYWKHCYMADDFHCWISYDFLFSMCNHRIRWVDKGSAVKKPMAMTLNERDAQHVTSYNRGETIHLGWLNLVI